MLSQAQTMKNKHLQQMKLELIRKLLDNVNSKEEFEYWKAEEKKLALLFSQSLFQGDQLNKFMEI